MGLHAVLLSAGQKEIPLVDIDSTVFIQFGIFLLLLLFLTRFVFSPFLALRRERSQQIEGAREEALMLGKTSEEKLGTYEKQIFQARKEAALVRERMRKEGEENASSLLADAHSKAEAQIAAARQHIEKSVQAAELGLRTRADHVARAVAEKLLGREI
jgi:F-type H+-transporting ATPase subunit b